MWQILLVAGDHNVIHPIREALPESRFVLRSVYSYRDALRELRRNRFDAILVDASAIDRDTGRLTLKILAGDRLSEPILAVITRHGQAQAFENLGLPMIPNLQPESIHTALLDVLDGKTPPHRSGEILSERSTNEINTFFALTQSLTEVLDLNTVLNRIVEAAQYLTNAEEGMILLPEGDTLYLRARVGIDLPVGQTFRIKTRDTLAGEVFNTGKPVLVGESGPQKVKTEYFVNTLLYVPIKLKGAVIGVLGVNNRQKRDVFTLRDQQLLLNLASFAAIALENARVHQESLERSHELETLVIAGEVLNDSLSLSDTLLSTCKQLASVLNMGYAEVLRWNPDQNQLVTITCMSQSLWRLEQGPPVDIAHFPELHTALQTGRDQWIICDPSKRPSSLDYPNATDAKTLLVIPVRLGGQASGCFRFFYNVAPHHPPTHNMIRQAQIAGLESLAEWLSRPDHATDQSTCWRGFQEMKFLVGADWGDLILSLDPQKYKLVMRIGSKVWLDSPSLTLNLKQYPDLRRALEAPEPIYLDGANPPVSPGLQVWAAKTYGSAVMGLPLVRRGQAQGMIMLAAVQPHRVFTPREMNIARAIVGQAATAIENAMLVHELEQSLRNLKNAQDRLVQAARLSAMGELATVIAHQINNPLTAIIADIALLLMDDPPDSPSHATLEAIERAGKRAAGVARHLLTIARPVDSSSAYERIDIVKSLQGVLALLQAHIERRHIQIRLRVPSAPLPPVMAVRGQLDDVWINLLMNAYDALRERDNGEVGLEVRHLPDQNRVQVTVWDNGPGIPSDLQTQIFSLFFTTKPVGEGTGVGLYICREIVESLGGSIHVESQPSPITRFIVSLPASPA